VFNIQIILISASTLSARTENFDFVASPEPSILGTSLMVLFASDIVLARGSQWPVVLLGVSLWGLHMGLTQGLLVTMVAHAAPSDLKGTAFGLFNLTTGLVTLVASQIAGELWDRFRANTTFHAGVGVCLLTLCALAVGGRLRRKSAF
jgi:predicted MFS family arabinose efflux permease